MRGSEFDAGDQGRIGAESQRWCARRGHASGPRGSPPALPHPAARRCAVRSSVPAREPRAGWVASVSARLSRNARFSARAGTRCSRRVAIVSRKIVGFAFQCLAHRTLVARDRLLCIGLQTCCRIGCVLQHRCSLRLGGGARVGKDALAFAGQAVTLVRDCGGCIGGLLQFGRGVGQQFVGCRAPLGDDRGDRAKQETRKQPDQTQGR